MYQDVLILEVGTGGFFPFGVGQLEVRNCFTDIGFLFLQDLLGQLVHRRTVFQLTGQAVYQTFDTSQIGLRCLYEILFQQVDTDQR